MNEILVVLTRSHTHDLLDGFSHNRRSKARTIRSTIIWLGMMKRTNRILFIKIDIDRSSPISHTEPIKASLSWIAFSFCCSCFSSCWLVPSERNKRSCCLRRLTLFSASNLHHYILTSFLSSQSTNLLVEQIRFLLLTQFHTQSSSSLQHRTRDFEKYKLTVFQGVLLGWKAIHNHRPTQIIPTC